MGVPMSQCIVPLAKVRAHQRGWSNTELALLHRAVSLLGRAGLSTETDGGVTDEGEPWFVICDAKCDAKSDEVVAHFARLGGTYVVCAPILNGALTGCNLADLVKRFLQRRLAAGCELQVARELITGFC
jgi:hypothetical protein